MIWNLRLSPINLDSGSGEPDPYAGSYYRFIADPNQLQRSMIDSIMVYDWEILFEKEGLGNWNFTLGSTPLNGVSPARPTFSVNYTSPLWEVLFEQSSVKESILSWIGQDDPYSDKSWGRVLKTGVTGRKTIDLKGPYWFSMEGRYHYYRGENVEGNQGVGTSLSIGRTKGWKQFNRSVGLFADAISFQDNHSFYTYGHGGYYSPELQVVVGPFVRLTTQKCKPYWFDIELSLGGSMRKTQDAPHYRDPDLNWLAPDFLNHSDLTSSYTGEKEFDASVNVNIRGMRHIGKNWYAAGSAGMTNTTGFQEIKAGIFLQYHYSETKDKTLCDAQRQIKLLMSTIH